MTAAAPAAEVAPRRRGPVDPRLLAGARVRRTVAADVLAAVVQALLLVIQAGLLASLIVRGAAGTPLADLGPAVAALAAVLVGRAVVGAGRGLLDQRAATAAKRRLRDRGVDAVLTGGTPQPAGAVATTLTSGLDALDDWFGAYLPALAEALVVPPVVLAYVATRDVWSAVLLGVTLPLAPIFLALVGMDARDRTRAQWRALQGLGAHLLEVVRGLPTLRLLGRADEQAAGVRAVAEDLRERTLRVLRVAFLSALVLELVAMLGTALVAVVVGLRLVSGQMDLEPALAALILAPEAYLPIRRVGAAFHASQDGAAAAATVLDGLAGPDDAPGAPSDAAPDPARGDIVLRGITVTRPGRRRPVLDDLTLRLPAGRLTVIAGPSGVGKSTVLDVLIGRVRPDRGAVEVGGAPADPASPAWRARLAWAPQRPALSGPTLADAVRLTAPAAADAVVEDAASRAGLAPVVDGLPEGWGTAVDATARPLSGGERRRLGLARALVRQAAHGAPLLVVDEPTADLDDAAAAVVRRALTAPGTTRVVASHDPVLADLADHVVRLGPAGRPDPGGGA